MKLWQRSNGIWYIKHGNRKVSLGTKDYNEAKRLFDEVKKRFTHTTFFEKIDENKEKSEKRKELKEVIDEFLEIKRVNNSESTFIRYREVLQNFINIVGNKRIDKITYSDIEKFKLERKKKGVKEVSINSDLRHLKAFLNYIRKAEYINDNLAERVEFYKISEVRNKYLSVDEIRKINELLLTDIENERKELLKKKVIKFEISVKEQLYVLFNIYIYSGRRRNEALNLRLQDIDFDNKVLYYYNQKAKRHSYLPLTEPLLSILQNYIERNKDKIKANNNRLFTVHYSTVTHGLKKYFRKINRDDIRVHDLRHTFASNLVNYANISMSVLKVLLDHSDISTTLIYSHISKEALENALSKLPY